MKDITPELLEKIEDSFLEKYKVNSKIKIIEGIIKSKQATHKDSNDYAIEVGKMLSEVFKEQLSAEVLPDGKMYYNIANRILNKTLGNNYNLITGVSEVVQKDLNTKANIGLNAVKPPLNQSRIDGIIERVSKEDDFDKIKWILDEPVINFSQAIIDDTIKTNAEFQYQVGYKPRIVRKVVGGCCDWCQAVAGTYEYPHEVTKDVYRRHRYCRCTVEYLPGDGRRQNVHNKKWIETENNDKINKRKELSDLPKVLKKENLPTENFTRGSGKNYPIKFVGSDHVKFDSDLVENITVIAGNGVSNEIRESLTLQEHYGQPKTRWQKLSGISHIRYKGKKIKAEIHWYEANGNRHEVKIKKVFKDEG
ncbi:hypothetical protein [Microaceticoccus formicicus]|uniref:hypothetical protein n=1 Tax=Microaceticoccus formicicus TaxID=3118105 RepID=UPI003CD00815|nr:hypothetical protein VZL98_04940 [Peptoniphilaceae bacterium AMB_02]